MDKNDPQHLLLQIIEILNNLNISYLVSGGMAVLVWGRPRFTADIDVIIELYQKDIAKLEEALKNLSAAGYIDRNMMEEALKIKGEFNFIDGDSGIKVDFWVLKNDDFDRSRLLRRQSKMLLGKNIFVSSAEDLILIKLQWYKNSKSSRHLEDVESIFKISGEALDRDYLKKWARKLKIEDELKKFLSS